MRSKAGSHTHSVRVWCFVSIVIFRLHSLWKPANWHLLYYTRQQFRINKQFPEMLEWFMILFMALFPFLFANCTLRITLALYVICTIWKTRKERELHVYFIMICPYSQHRMVFLPQNGLLAQQWHLRVRDIWTNFTIMLSHHLIKTQTKSTTRVFICTETHMRHAFQYNNQISNRNDEKAQRRRERRKTSSWVAERKKKIIIMKRAKINNIQREQKCVGVRWNEK